MSHIIVHYSIADASDDDLVPVDTGCWPCLDFFPKSNTVELVWAEEPACKFIITTESMRWRISPGFSADALRQALAPTGALSRALMGAGENIKSAATLFRSCDVAAETLDALSETNIRR